MSYRDNWERLVAAVVKRDQIWQLCHQDSISTISSSNSSQRVLSSSISNPRRVSSSPSPDQLPLPNDYVVREDRFELKRFSLREMILATDSFNVRLMVGRGAYCKVYQGRLADGSLVAVERYDRQLDQVKIEKVIEIRSLVAHRNVHHLRGFCITQTEQLLVSSYMAKGSVAACLRWRHKKEPPLNWETRNAIALGAARGLAYLHHECQRGIIHGDVTAGNILLDEYNEAVVSGFALAEFTDYHSDGIVRGTSGFIAPEYLSTGMHSNKSDVYGYGFFLLDLIKGQRCFDRARLENDSNMMILDWVSKHCKDKNFKKMVGPDLIGNCVDEEVEKLLQIALICTQTDPKRRPTMSEVVRMLEDEGGLPQRWQAFSFFTLQQSSAQSIDGTSFNLCENELSGRKETNRLKAVLRLKALLTTGWA